MFLPIWFFLTGLVMASFLTATAFRVENKKKRLSVSQLLTKPSFCDTCGKQLRWFELVPVLSYIFQRGKCRKCNSPIPLWNLVGEMLLGVTFLIFTLSGVSIVYYVVALILFYLSALDVIYNRIPKKLIHGLLLGSLLFYILFLFLYILHGVEWWTFLRTCSPHSAVGIACSNVSIVNLTTDYSNLSFDITIFLPMIEAILLVIFMSLINMVKRSFGVADLLLLMFLACFAQPEPNGGLFLLGFGWIFKVFFIAALASTLFILPLILHNRKWLKQRIPFIPFLLIGYVVVVAFRL